MCNTCMNLCVCVYFHLGVMVEEAVARHEVSVVIVPLVLVKRCSTARLGPTRTRGASAPAWRGGESDPTPRSSAGLRRTRAVRPATRAAHHVAARARPAPRCKGGGAHRPFLTSHSSFSITSWDLSSSGMSKGLLAVGRCFGGGGGGVRFEGG